MTVLHAIRVPEKLDKKLRAIAYKERLTWTALVVRLLAKAMKGRKA